MYLFYSVSVEACVFLTRTQYDTNRWTPGGNIMMVKSQDNGESWSQPQARASSDTAIAGGFDRVCIRYKLTVEPCSSRDATGRCACTFRLCDGCNMCWRRMDCCLFLHPF